MRERVGGDAADLREVPPEQAHAWPTSCFRFCFHLQIQRLTCPCCSCPPSQVSAEKRTNYSNNTWWSSSPPNFESLVSFVLLHVMQGSTLYCPTTNDLECCRHESHSPSALRVLRQACHVHTYMHAYHWMASTSGGTKTQFSCHACHTILIYHSVILWDEHWHDWQPHDIS